MSKWVCVIFRHRRISLWLIGVISICGIGYSASEIIVSAQSAIYCLDSNGNLKWSFPHPTFMYQASGAAIGDIDNDGSPEILVGADRLYCLSYDGILKWWYPITVNLCSPAIANVDTLINVANHVEVIVAELYTLYCFNGDGSMKWTYPITGNYFGGYIGPAVSVANIDTTLTPEVFAVTPSYVYCLDCDGNLKWSFNMPGDRYVGIAVADLNLDNTPEIVISNTQSIYCLRSDGTQKWVYNSSAGYVSQPAIADINSDTKPEIVFYAYPKIYAFQENTAGNGLDLVWEADVEDVTGMASSTPPVICDIDGDLDKDVLWVGWDGTGGINPLYILNGLDGKHPDNSGGTCYTNDNFGVRTLCERGVAVADIDDDGKVEIVGISANSGDIYGVAVIECDSFWADSRDLFTSHLYHISEINDDVTVPKIEPNSWQSHNTWLTQLTTGGSGFGNPTLKWDYANTGFGWIVASIAIAPVYNPPGAEEKEFSKGHGARILYNPSGVVIRFSVSKSEEVSFRIFDLVGRERKTINIGTMAPGVHEMPLNVSNFGNGVYFVQARIGDRIFNCKTIVIR